MITNQYHGFFRNRFRPHSDCTSLLFYDTHINITPIKALKKGTELEDNISSFALVCSLVLILTRAINKSDLCHYVFLLLSTIDTTAIKPWPGAYISDRSLNYG